MLEPFAKAHYLPQSNPSLFPQAFKQFITDYGKSQAWSRNSSYTAVMVEFRPYERELAFSIKNIMDNLPVNWRVQVGCRCVEMLGNLERWVGCDKDCGGQASLCAR